MKKNEELYAVKIPGEIAHIVIIQTKDDERRIERIRVDNITGVKMTDLSGENKEFEIVIQTEQPIEPITVNDKELADNLFTWIECVIEGKDIDGIEYEL